MKLQHKMHAVSSNLSLPLTLQQRCNLAHNLNGHRLQNLSLKL